MLLLTLLLLLLLWWWWFLCCRYIVAYTFFPVSLVFLIYPLVIYYWRSKKILNKASGSYNDHFGPPAIVAVLLVAGIVNTYFVIDADNYAQRYAYSALQGLPADSDTCTLALQGSEDLCPGMTDVNGFALVDGALLMSSYASVCLSKSRAESRASMVSSPTPAFVATEGTVGMDILDVTVAEQSATASTTTMVAAVNATSTSGEDPWLYLLTGTGSDADMVPLSASTGGFVSAQNPVSTIASHGDGSLYAATAQGILVGTLDAENRTVKFDGLIRPFLVGRLSFKAIGMAVSATHLYLLEQPVAGVGAASVEVIGNLDTGRYSHENSFTTPGSDRHWSGIAFDDTAGHMYLANQYPANVWQFDWSDDQGFTLC